MVHIEDNYVFVLWNIEGTQCIPSKERLRAINTGILEIFTQHDKRVKK
jgi:hypothetical protein